MVSWNNLPGPAKNAILRKLEAKSLARLQRTGVKNQANITKELRAKQNEKIEKQFRPKAAVLHDNSNKSYEMLEKHIQKNSQYKIGDIVTFNSNRNEYGLGVISFNRNTMRKKIASSEGLYNVSEHIPKYVKEHIKSLNYDNVERFLREKFWLNDNVRLHVKNDLLGVPYNQRNFT